MDQTLIPQRRVNDLISVAGFDPSLRNWGIAKGTLDVHSKDVIITSLDVIKTSVSKDKTVRKNSTDLDRAEALVKGAVAALQGVQAVFVEVPVGSQTARAMTSYGICVGVLASLRAQGYPIHIVTPDEVKAVTGIKNASKQQMIDWAFTKHPDADWPIKKEHNVESLVESTAEHMADAVAAIHAGINSQPFKQLLALLNPMQS